MGGFPPLDAHPANNNTLAMLASAGHNFVAAM
jgi:hypothetical protein